MFNLPEEEDEFNIFGPQMQPPAPPQAPAPISPEIKSYLAKKFDLGEFTQANRDKLASENEVGFGDKAQAAIAALGAGFMGKDAAGAGLGVLDRARQSGKGKLEEFDKGRANKIADYKIGQEVAGDERENAKFDPTSTASVSARQMIETNFPQVAKAYGDKWADVTAGDMDTIFKPLQLKEQVDARRDAAALAAGTRADAREDRRLQRDLLNNEKEQKLKTPYGLANSEDDAKQLKTAFESKKNFDQKINEMIALREKHKGGALMDREDVARGKQLSKDLLLEYKNMAKLGVLSAADEAIINAIIPKDPLEYNSPLAAVQGQDPTLNRLKKFKADSESDFATKVGTRTRAGIDTIAKERDVPPGGGKVEMVDPKGRKKLVDKKDVAAALAAGGQLVQGHMVGGN